MTRAAFLASAAGLVLAACGSSSGSGEPAAAGADGNSAPETSARQAGPTAVVDGAVVPRALVGATTVDGDPFDAETLKGRPTVAWFWAPWCTICRGEAPDVKKVVEEYSDRVNFVGIAGRSEAPEMRGFVKDTGVGSFTHLDDSSGTIWAAYEIYAQPSFAFITADGRTETFTGGLGADDLAGVVEQLLVA